MQPFDTPILIIIFNRPDKVRALVDALAQVRPTKLFISADGPRAHVPTDPARCAEARAIAQDISWPCEIKTNFLDSNVGFARGVETAITWFFRHEEEGVILEDDCIPNTTFFRFAKEMLLRYRDNERIMMVSGNNFQNGQTRGKASYYFSIYPNIWGWATWKRAWAQYENDLVSLPRFEDLRGAETICPDSEERRYWMKYFKSLREGKRVSWDAKLVYAVWKANGLCVVPNVNLVENIGFDKDATNTIGTSDNLKHKALPMPDILHPSEIAANREADEYLFDTIYRATLKKRLSYYWHKIIN